MKTLNRISQLVFDSYIGIKYFHLSIAIMIIFISGFFFGEFAFKIIMVVFWTISLTLVLSTLQVVFKNEYRNTKIIQTIKYLLAFTILLILFAPIFKTDYIMQLGMWLIIPSIFIISPLVLSIAINRLLYGNTIPTKYYIKHFFIFLFFNISGIWFLIHKIKRKNPWKSKENIY
jgi:hypothetical protein